MNYLRILSIAVLCVFITSSGTADLTNDDINLSLSEKEIVQGDTIEATVSLQGHDESNYTFDFTVDRDGQVVTSNDTSANITVLREAHSIAVWPKQDGERLEYRDNVDIEVEESNDFGQIRLDPAEIVPGEPFTATVTIDGEEREDLTYEWNVAKVTGEGYSDTRKNSGPTVTLTAREDGRAPEDASIEVEVREGDEELGELWRAVEWDTYEADVDGIDAVYGDGYAHVEIAEDRLEDDPTVRLGTSITGWKNIQFNNFRVGGGIEMNLTEVPPDTVAVGDDLVVYAAMEVTGTSLQGIDAWYEADVARDWLEEHDLLVTDDVADVSFYREEDGGFARIPSRTGPSERENYLSLVPDLGEITEEERYAELEEGLTLVIAGKPDGIDRGRYATGPDGQCESLDEDEPVPYGWEAIGVSCDIHRDAVTVHEDLNRTMSVDRERSTVPEEYAIPDRFRDRAESIRNLLDSYEVREAQNRTEQLEEDLEEYQDAMRENQRRQENFDRAKDRFEIPDGYETTFNWSARIESLITDYRQQLDDGNLEAARATAEELNRLREERRNQIRILRRVVDDIQQLNATDLTEDQEADLLEARTTLEDGNLTAAKEQVEAIKEERRDTGITAKVAEMVRTILERIMGGGSFQAQADQAAVDQQFSEGIDEPNRSTTNGSEGR